MGLPKARTKRFWVFLMYSSELFPAASQTRWCRVCCCNRPSSRGIPRTPTFLSGYYSDADLPRRVFFRWKPQIRHLCYLKKVYSTGYATYIYISLCNIFAWVFHTVCHIFIYLFIYDFERTDEAWYSSMGLPSGRVSIYIYTQ